MYIAPNSTVKFYSDIPIVTGRQIAFSTKANQTAYFNSKLVATYTPTTYVRPNEILKVDSGVVPYTTAMRINYLSFVNPDFENITWYAKVTSTNYTNNGCVEMTFALDLFQSFMNDIDFDTCIMEREQLSVSDYDKSVANPYDYDIIELQTDESLPVPNEVYDYPALFGQKDDTSSKRTFLPGGWEDDANEKLAEKIMMYTLVMSSPLDKLTYSISANDTYETELGIGIGVPEGSNPPIIDRFISDIACTFDDEGMKKMLCNAGFNNAVRQENTDDSSNRRYVPLGNFHKIRNIKKVNPSESGTNRTVNGLSWIAWPYQSGNTIGGSSANLPYDAGFGCFGFNMNNINNQTIILATSNYNKMASILDVITKNDCVSCILGMYVLPLSFLALIHASNLDTILSTNFEVIPTDDDEPDGRNLTDNNITLFKEEISPMNFSQVKNKKLLTFPYQYIKVTDPSGLSKEYKFEDFTEFQTPLVPGQESSFTAKFTLLGDLTGNPKIEMYPYLYKIYETGDSFGEECSFRKKLNVNERMEFTDFPQQAYMTDAFTAYVANRYAQESLMNTTNRLWSSQEGVEGSIDALSGYTKQAAGEKRGLVGGILEFFGLDNSVNLSLLSSPITDNRYVNGMTDRTAGKYASTTMGSYSMNGVSAVSGAAAALQTGGRIGSNIVNTFGPGSADRRTMEADQMAASAENAIAEKRLRSAALDWCDGTYKISPYLNAAKGAFRMNDYHAGTGSGMLPYFLGGFKFTFDVMKLKPEFIAKYDEYFTNYGYNSTRVGIPHIQTYLQGTKTGDAPKFLENADGYYVTYIKTISCKVNHYNRMIASFIEGLFDGGIQLIDGDTLL